MSRFARFRKPTEREVSEALRYTENEYEPCPRHVDMAHALMPQLTDSQWISLAASADFERSGQLMPYMYSIPEVTK